MADAPNMPFDAYLSLLRPHGHLVIVGIAEEETLPNVHPFNLIGSMYTSLLNGPV
jgi:alcohol dehydrogenase (NADP+)